MKKGDIFIGSTPQELIDSGMVCHKSVEHVDDNDSNILCGVKQDRTTVTLSHDKWEYVTCPNCLSLKMTN